MDLLLTNSLGPLRGISSEETFAGEVDTAAQCPYGGDDYFVKSSQRFTYAIPFS